MVHVVSPINIQVLTYLQKGNTMKIEIITTPNRYLKETGFGAEIACESILKSLRLLKYKGRLSICKDKYDLEEVLKRKPDLVILAVKYIALINEPDIWLSDYFKKHNVNYTGSNKETLKFDSNKILAKSFLKRKGIPTADFFTAIPKEYKQKELPLKFPLFLKPMDAANGNGIDDKSFVNTFKEYENKLLSLYSQFNEPVLVEKYLDGREFTVSIIKNKNSGLGVYAIEIIAPQSKDGLRILGEKAKKENSEILKYISNPDLKQKIEKLACDSFTNLGVRDFGRVDIKTNKEGECFFLEANLVPGMTEGSSYFPKACELSDELSYTNVVELMLENAISRIEITQGNG